MDERELIYSEIAEAIEGQFICYTSQRYEPIPAQIPCVFIQQISKTRTRQYATLDNSDNQYRLTFEVQVFAESLDGAYEIMNFIEDKFKSLAFFEDMCTPVDNGDPALFRLVARFTAQRGSF